MPEPAGGGRARGIGASVPRPDGPAKVSGAFQFASDLTAPGMLYGKTLRSEHPHAVVRRIDTARAERLPGVKAILTARDVPGLQTYGLDRVRDQPVLVAEGGEVRYAGEPLAVVAAEHPEQALQAARAIDVE